MEPVFITGQYKCGTTWLLRALSVHPQVRGIAEIDIVRATYDLTAPIPKFASLDDRLRRVFDASGWCAELENGKWLYRDVVEKFRTGAPLHVGKKMLNIPQKFFCLSEEAAYRLYQEISNAKCPHEMMDAFIASVSSEPEGKTHLILKAADQIYPPVFELLKQWQPRAKKIAITRDGRDAAISAFHYNRLIANDGAPWAEGSDDLFEILATWKTRASALIDLARRGELKLLRYEDLWDNFSAALTPLLRWLGLEVSENILKEMERQSSFEALAGRPRGIDDCSVYRRGIIREWADTLTRIEKEIAWVVAGEELEALGYSQNGEHRSLSLFSSSF